MYGLTLASTVPSPAVLDLQIAKRHCRVTHAEDDTYFEQLIAAAGAAAELATHRQLLTATYDLVRDRFPCGRQSIRLPLGQWQETTSITYLDTNGDAQTLDPDDYTTVGVEPAEIWPAYNVSWPVTRCVAGAVTTRFVTGYGDTWEAIPTLLRQGLLLLVGHWYVHREAVVVGMAAGELPLGVRSIFAQFTLGDDFDEYGG